MDWSRPSNYFKFGAANTQVPSGELNFKHIKTNMLQGNVRLKFLWEKPSLNHGALKCYRLQLLKDSEIYREIMMEMDH